MATIYLYGSAAQFFRYQRALEALGGHVCFGGDPDNYQALLLPGGGDLEPWRYGQPNIASHHLEPERDSAEFALLEHFSVRRKPILGICRGLQVINVFFGGTLWQNISGHNAANGIDRLHYVRTAPSPLQSICGQNCIVNSAHHQAVDRLGAALEVLQWAPDGTVEALRHDTLPILALQWHPERLSTPVGTNLLRLFLSCCN